MIMRVFLLFLAMHAVAVQEHRIDWHLHNNITSDLLNVISAERIQQEERENNIQDLLAQNKVHALLELEKKGASDCSKAFLTYQQLLMQSPWHGKNAYRDIATMLFCNAPAMIMASINQNTALLEASQRTENTMRVMTLHNFSVLTERLGNGFSKQLNEFSHDEKNIFFDGLLERYKKHVAVYINNVVALDWSVVYNLHTQHFVLEKTITASVVEEQARLKMCYNQLDEYNKTKKETFFSRIIWSLMPAYFNSDSFWHTIMTILKTGVSDQNHETEILEEYKRYVANAYRDYRKVLYAKKMVQSAAHFLQHQLRTWPWYDRGSVKIFLNHDSKKSFSDIVIIT